MKQFFESGAARIGAAIHHGIASVDLEVLSLPGGSLIAALLLLYASAKGSVKRIASPDRTSDEHPVRLQRPGGGVSNTDLAERGHPMQPCVGCG
ncbi:MAG TPA: hypothetical protein VK437_01640 [Steroidobacteraceae bacterium]|nr:hypothetical protein [Steroidobacteraceae bacterium]